MFGLLKVIGKSRQPRRSARPRRITHRLGLEVLEDRWCPSTTIDARALSLPALALDSGAAFSTGQVQTLNLAPGMHTLSSVNGFGGSASFSVAPDGTVGYSSDTALDGLFSGRGTGTLGVNGRTITLDARPLSLTALTLDEQMTFPTRAPFSATVLPGSQLLMSEPGGFGGTVAFTVGDGGQVDYAAGLDGALAGRGTATLGVLGRTITLDAHPLTLTALTLDERLTFPTRAPFTATVLPGAQLLMSEPGGFGGTVAFTVGDGGQVDYAAGLDGALAGRGTAALGVSGRTITLDAHPLTLTALTLDEQLTFPTGAPFSATVLPGAQLLMSEPAGFAGSVAFTVGDGGQVDYAAGLDGALAGRGTATLGVNGRTITLDAHALSLSSLFFYGRGQFDTAAPITATVLPGSQLLRTVTGFTTFVPFSVTNEGTVDYANPLAFSDILEGRGTTTLTVKGETIHIDARALSATTATFTLDGIGTFATSAVQSLTLLPGWETFRAGTEVFNFKAELFDTVDYDPIYDALAHGRDTDTLVVFPPLM